MKYVNLFQWQKCLHFYLYVMWSNFYSLHCIRTLFINKFTDFSSILENQILDHPFFLQATYTPTNQHFFTCIMMILPYAATHKPRRIVINDSRQNRRSVVTASIKYSSEKPQKRNSLTTPPHTNAHCSTAPEWDLQRRRPCCARAPSSPRRQVWWPGTGACCAPSVSGQLPASTSSSASCAATSSTTCCSATSPCTRCWTIFSCSRRWWWRYSPTATSRSGSCNCAGTALSSASCSKRWGGILRPRCTFTRRRRGRSWNITY